MRTLADVLDLHCDISPATERLIETAYERHPQRAELDRLIADGVWLLGFRNLTAASSCGSATRSGSDTRTIRTPPCG